MSKETIKHALLRALSAMIMGAASSFAVITVNLDEPKKYFISLAIGMLAGALMGLQKAISGWIKYDKK